MTDNPSESDVPRPNVHIAHGPDAYANTLAALAPFDLSVVKNKRVLLKPNIGRMAAFGTGVNTNPQVVAAAIDAFRNAGAEVAIGESPITGVKTMEAFALSGITAMANERNCPLIDLDARPPVITPVPDGKVIDS
ncbi:MAG: DUF362 domain-containing protein, partial [Kiritimatiellaceae bacterium]|nr:DUF362 domain-containing protein [Kiritimatiellaceae bacterium]